FWRTPCPVATPSGCRAAEPPAASPPRPATGAALQQDHLALDVARHPRGVIADEHVDLRAHAEIRQINSRLHREATPRHHPPLVVRLEIVHVRAVAVHL